MASTWTDELREQVKNMYLEGNPTPENSTELVKNIADEVGESANGVRMALMQMQVYVKKTTATAEKPSAKKEGEGSKRVSKDSLIGELRDAITARGGEVDEDIITKLTGKAAAYFTKVLTA